MVNKYSSRMETLKGITGLVLAGGRGTRMGSVDKGLQDFGGTPMVVHVITRLLPQVQALHINANQNLDTYRSMGYTVSEDAVGGFAGPLAGLHSGLLQCQTPWLVTAPCDSPYLPLDLVVRLQNAQQATGADLAVPVTGVGASRQVHPVFCLVRSDLLPHLSAFLASGGRKVDAWYSTLAVAEVSFSNESAFRNINTMAELQAWKPESPHAT
jgi:molybdenum cofactor guanylyltransferase